MMVKRENFESVVKQYNIKHFSFEEFVQEKDKLDIAFIDLDLLLKLEKLRECYGKAIIITSGWRSLEHNKNVGGVGGSYHIRGMAVDIKVANSYDRYKLVKCAMDVGFNGIIIYDTHIHLDVRNELVLTIGRRVRA